MSQQSPGVVGRHRAAEAPESAEDGLDWLVRSAWPVWLQRGVDWRKGAFHEHLDLHTLACKADFRRLRVAARQTYVFSTAAAYGAERAAEGAELGLAFLLRRARQPEGGYARRFDLDNRPIDQTRDLYDHAFVMLAFASAAPLRGVAERRRDALELLAYLDRFFRHAEGGYEESLPPSRPRRQNPHMHLLEALLACHEAFGDEVFLARAGALLDLFLDRLFQSQDGALPEFFDNALVPLRQDGRYVVEPGHAYEWAWLLARYRAAGQAARGDEIAAASSALLRFAERYGVNGRNQVVNEVWSDGAPKSRSVRLWPQTERMKVEARARRNQGKLAGFGLLRPHLDGVAPGLWRERLDEEGRPVDEPAPASSLYHLTCAITETTRRTG